MKRVNVHEDVHLHVPLLLVALLGSEDVVQRVHGRSVCLAHGDGCLLAL